MKAIEGLEGAALLMHGTKAEQGSVGWEAILNRFLDTRGLFGGFL